MAKILEMPKLSPTMEEGVLATWHKKAGDSVEVDDLLAEVETDKATMEFRAFDKGTLLKLLVEPGATVKLGQAVAILGDAGEDIRGLAAGDDARPPAPEPEPEPAPARKRLEERRARRSRSRSEKRVPHRSARKDRSPRAHRARRQRDGGSRRPCARLAVRPKARTRARDRPRGRAGLR